jgi:hypothetical protein
MCKGQYRNRYAETDSEFLARIVDALRREVVVIDNDEGPEVSSDDIDRLDQIRRRVEDRERYGVER